MNYIGINMNKIWLFIFFISASCFAKVSMYWDLGVAISSNPSQLSTSIDLLAFHRTEGLKQYYAQNYEDAIYHFEELNQKEQCHILYEYIHSYYLLGDYEKAITILSLYSNDELSENMLYLKSQTLVLNYDYNQAILVLDYLQSHYPSSDYSNIIKFNLEKINLLK